MVHLEGGPILGGLQGNCGGTEDDLGNERQEPACVCLRPGDSEHF